MGPADRLGDVRQAVAFEQAAEPLVDPPDQPRPLVDQPRHQLDQRRAEVDLLVGVLRREDAPPTPMIR